MDQRLKVRPKTVKVTDKNIGKFCGIDFYNNFLHMASKAQATKGK